MKSGKLGMEHIKMILVLWVIALGSMSPFMQLSSEAQEVSAVETAVPANGWYKVSGASYYYKNSKKVTGWQKIAGKTYYFDKKTGKLQKNKIVGDTAKTRYYVDKQGVRVNDKVVNLAVKFVYSQTKASWSNSKKLKACYKYLWKNCSYKRFYDKEAKSKMPQYATYMFTYKRGNCYRGAAAFAYVARVLGYESRVAVGGVSSHSSGALSVHGWTEIKMDDKWYMFDISMQRPRPNQSLYKLTRKEYPFRLRCDRRYTLSVSSGKVKWK